MNRSQKKWWSSNEKSLTSALRWAQLRCFAIPTFLYGHHNTKELPHLVQSKVTILGTWRIERRDCCFVKQFDGGVVSHAYESCSRCDATQAAYLSSCDLLSRNRPLKRYTNDIDTGSKLRQCPVSVLSCWRSLIPVVRLVIFCIWRHVWRVFERRFLLSAPQRNIFDFQLESWLDLPISTTSSEIKQCHPIQ